MMAFRQCVVVLLVAMRQPSVNGQSMEEMIQHTEEAYDARFEAKMHEQMRMMSGSSATGLPEATDDTGGMGSMTKMPQKPPGPKQIAVKKARAFMKEILDLLSTQEAKEALDIAREGMSTSTTNDGGQPWQSLVLAIGPVIDKRTKQVVKHYGFASDFEQAMAAVGEARQRKGDKELTAAMEHLNEIFTGEISQAKLGLIPELSKLAEGFLDMAESGRQDAIATAMALQEEAKDDQRSASIGRYIEAMKGLLDKGNSYVKDRIAELVASAKIAAKKEPKPTAEDIGSFNMHVNILSEFLHPEEKEEPVSQHTHSQEL